MTSLNVLVLGSEGFIGSHVREQLERLGARVVGVDSLEPRVHGPNPRPTPGTIVCDYADTPSEAVAAADVIVHLAAQVGVADSMDDPERYVRQNTLGTVRFLETLRRAVAGGQRDRRLVVASSMSVYGAGTGRPDAPVTEDSPVSPASVYGLTKFDQERLCIGANGKGAVSAVALRFFNVYGPRQALTNPYTGVIANFANWLLHDEPPVVYEDGLQTRDFVHVQDVANAVVRCATAPALGHRVYNVCTGVPTSILGVAQELGISLGKRIQPRVTGTCRPGDIRHCVGSPARFLEDFPDWKPRDFATGIRQYAAWLRAHD